MKQCIRCLENKETVSYIRSIPKKEEVWLCSDCINYIIKLWLDGNVF